MSLKPWAMRRVRHSQQVRPDKIPAAWQIFILKVVLKIYPIFKKGIGIPQNMVYNTSINITYMPDLKTRQKGGLYYDNQHL